VAAPEAPLEVSVMASTDFALKMVSKHIRSPVSILKLATELTDEFLAEVKIFLREIGRRECRFPLIGMEPECELSLVIR
jgi:hypothetical protein